MLYVIAHFSENGHIILLNALKENNENKESRFDNLISLLSRIVDYSCGKIKAESSEKGYPNKTRQYLVGIINEIMNNELFEARLMLRMELIRAGLTVDLINSLIKLEEIDTENDCDCILIRVCRNYLQDRSDDINDIKLSIEDMVDTIEDDEQLSKAIEQPLHKTTSSENHTLMTTLQKLLFINDYILFEEKENDEPVDETLVRMAESNNTIPSLIQHILRNHFNF